MNTRLIEVLAKLDAPRILVLGDLILDRYVWGSVNRVSPEAPVQILNVGREEYRPGGASNVVHNLAALGARVSCGGIVGKDEGGRALLSLLRAGRSDVSAVIRDPLKPTSVKTRMPRSPSVRTRKRSASSFKIFRAPASTSSSWLIVASSPRLSEAPVARAYFR